VAGGTFTITNPGVFGALFGMPIISQPQVAILGIGNVEKRAVVIDDAIAIRPMAYLTLGYDHRVIDGAVADEFMSIIKKALENWDPNAV
jgi:pyruvate/2-oxoglutarate dehydrogenase complex dihydrolipoamide acyltransferase (E2) component